MQTILEFMGSDHHACDDLFAAAEAAVAKNYWDSARSLFDGFQAAMAHHLAREEEGLRFGDEVEAGFSVRQWGRAGDDYAQKTAFGAAAKLRLFQGNPGFPAIALYSYDSLYERPGLWERLRAFLTAHDPSEVHP